MERSEAIRYWAESLDALLWQWEPARLRALEPVLPELLRALGLSAGEVLAEVSDEGLALAVQKEFLLKPAFEELFVNRYTEPLHRWFLHWKADWHRVEDLTQQLLVAFYERRLRSYRPEHSFRAYLRQSAYNLWVQKTYRARQARPLEGVPEPAAAGAEQAVLVREMERRLGEAMSRLPPEQRRVLAASMEGRTAEEIARDIGRTRRAAFMLLFRARRAVEADLGIASRRGV
jgi:RNA polymerase sigma factor (sigma-70 family)